MKPTCSPDQPFQLILYIFQNKTLKDASVLWIHYSEPQVSTSSRVWAAVGHRAGVLLEFPRLSESQCVPGALHARPRGAPCGPERRCAARAPGSSRARAEAAASAPEHRPHCRHICTSAKTSQHPVTDWGGISQTISFHPAAVGWDTFH